MTCYAIYTQAVAEADADRIQLDENLRMSGQLNSTRR